MLPVAGGRLASRSSEVSLESVTLDLVEAVADQNLLSSSSRGPVTTCYIFFFAAKTAYTATDTML
jgi:hypothetical protein